RGWPVDPAQLAGERASARLDLARALAASGRVDAALALAEEAAGLHPEHAARAHLARAELLLAERRADEARDAARDAAAAVLPHDRALRARIDALLQALER
ncbi:MAG: hypothetical protein KF878_28620, partial [Planctomycetes bacterium]|nr:hypothetical protein [Planctomycetota bacterium]